MLLVQILRQTRWANASLKALSRNHSIDFNRGDVALRRVQHACHEMSI